MIIMIILIIIIIIIIFKPAAVREVNVPIVSDAVCRTPYPTVRYLKPYKNCKIVKIVKRKVTEFPYFLNL